MAAERYTRTSASPVHAAMMQKRHKFGVDGRILLVPIIFPCVVAIPFAHTFLHQVMCAGIAALVWFLAKIAWGYNPYLLDDFMAECSSPRALSDDVPPQRRIQRSAPVMKGARK